MAMIGKAASENIVGNRSPEFYNPIAVEARLAPLTRRSLEGLSVYRRS